MQPEHSDPETADVPEAPRRQEVAVIAPGHTFGSVTDKISSIVLTSRPPRGWWIGFFISFGLVLLLFIAISYLLAIGVGIWGINIPVAWGFAIVNFVWWIGIGHAGTLISAISMTLRARCPAGSGTTAITDCWPSSIPSRARPI